ncbi:hypothetical protein ACFLQU_05880 [Verrucomicrobiota bacterium]
MKVRIEQDPITCELGWNTWRDEAVLDVEVVEELDDAMREAGSWIELAVVEDRGDELVLEIVEPKQAS